ncbi:MAG: hypothetical protein AUG44_26375 [Actinobacteria bacterium 13_1_20CM_3_71_11]|nr:MAG: hypothetical protein AUG44_26375 [Actinobacteria bacterium 13_1_20CM_3_71_11]
MRVLVCDDHVVFAESLAHLLGALGPEVVAITFHPNQAIPVLRREQVDVCLLDVLYGAENVLDRLPDIRAAAPATRRGARRRRQAATGVGDRQHPRPGTPR